MTIGERFAHAYRWRTCPACRGSGQELNIARWRVVPCYLCGSGGAVRFRLHVALLLALGWGSREMVENQRLDDERQAEMEADS